MGKNFKGWEKYKPESDDVGQKMIDDIKKGIKKIEKLHVIKAPIDWKIYRFIIGIDTGTKTGFAIWDREQRGLLRVETMQIHQALIEVHGLCQFERLLENRYFVRVEDARLAVHGRNNEKDAFKMQGAGSVKRDAAIWEAALIDWNIDYEMVRPKKAITKMDAELFKKVTGWPGRCSSHARDAAVLVYGL